MDKEISDKALKFVKSNKKVIQQKFANDEICLKEEHPVCIFMAGSPGAGKTEFSKEFLSEANLRAVRIDADEIRDFIPYYDKTNADSLQRAAALGVEYVYDFALEKKKNILLDATFADYKKSFQNIQRAVSRGRYVEIYYLFQDPLIAWQFTKAREAIEGRPVPKEIFLNALFHSRENVNNVKSYFGDKVKLNVVVKNFKNALESFKLNVPNVDTVVKMNYNIEMLDKLL